MSECERDEQGGSERHGRNGNVNHGPDETSGGTASGGVPETERSPAAPDEEAAPEDARSEEATPEQAAPEQETGPVGPVRSLEKLIAAQGAGSGPAPRDEDFGADELALRRMMRQAVQEIEPSERSLDHLRQAVPARRARKRQAVVGLAAAALFIGTAVPALVHVTNARGEADDRPAIAGSSQESQGGSGKSKGAEGAAKDPGKRPDKSKSKDKKDKKGKKEGKGKDGSGGGGTGSPDPATSEAATSPACSAAQLAATGGAGTGDGKSPVYGSFRVSNISDSSCTVESAGAVAVTAQGAADPARVTVVDHTAGDAASELPDPSTEASPLVLRPGSAYEVRFAWVPSDSCPTDGGGGEPTPDPTPSEGGGATGSPDSGTPEGTEPQLVRSDGGVKDGSVVVSLTAEAGAPSAGTTVANACAGTVYRTGILPAS